MARTSRRASSCSTYVEGDLAGDARDAVRAARRRVPRVRGAGRGATAGAPPTAAPPLELRRRDRCRRSSPGAGTRRRLGGSRPAPRPGGRAAVLVAAARLRRRATGPDGRAARISRGDGPRAAAEERRPRRRPAAEPPRPAARSARGPGQVPRGSSHGRSDGVAAGRVRRGGRASGIRHGRLRRPTASSAAPGSTGAVAGCLRRGRPGPSTDRSRPEDARSSPSSGPRNRLIRRAVLLGQIEVERVEQLGRGARRVHGDVRRDMEERLGVVEDDLHARARRCRRRRSGRVAEPRARRR